jgi:hypothetical protein
VPKNKTRSEVAGIFEGIFEGVVEDGEAEGRESDIVRSVFFVEKLLLAFLHVEAALESTNAVDEEDAVEVVDLMLDTDGA